MLTSGSHMFVHIDSAVIKLLGITKPKSFFPKQQPYSIWRFIILYGFLSLKNFFNLLYYHNKTNARDLILLAFFMIKNM